MLSLHNENPETSGPVVGYSYKPDILRNALYLGLRSSSSARGYSRDQSGTGTYERKNDPSYFNRLDQPELDLANRKITDPICEILRNKTEKHRLERD